jgi:hypothetical protein
MTTIDRNQTFIPKLFNLKIIIFAKKQILQKLKI